MTERVLNVSFGEDFRSKSVESKQITWSDFIDEIKEFRVINYSHEDYKQLDRNTKSNLKNGKFFIFGRSNGGRCEKDIISREGLTLDFDECSFEDMNNTITRLKESKINYCLYTTASFNGNNGKFRIVIPFNKAIDTKDYRSIAINFTKSLNLPVIDEASYKPAQLFFYPCSLLNVNPIFDYRIDGEYIDVSLYHNNITHGNNKQEEQKESNTTANNTLNVPKPYDDTNVYKYDRETALLLVKKYVDNEINKADNYEFFVPMLMSIVKGVRDKEISYYTGLAAVEVLAKGNTDWAEENRKKFIYEYKNTDIKTKYGFSDRYDFNPIDNKGKKNLKLLAENISNLIMSDFKVVKYGEDIYFYNGKRYSNDLNQLKRIVYNKAKGERSTFIDEVLKQIDYRCRYIPADTPMKIALKNGYLDNGEFFPVIYEDFTPYRIDVNYYEDCEPVKIVDDYIDKLTDNDPEYKNLLLEVLGHTLIVNSEFKRAVGKFFIFIGDGGNGKGTLLEIIAEILGRDNVCFLSIKDLADDRYSSSIRGKLANLGDDLQDQSINDKDMKILKNISTCDSFTTRRLYKDPEKIKPTTTLIFTSNHLIKSFEKGKSYRRRVMWLPMYSKVEKVDPYFISKLTTDKALEYWIFLFIKGYKRLYSNRNFTRSMSVNNFNENYHKENNPAFLYIEDKTIDDFLHKPVNVVNWDYEVWCDRNDYPRNKKFLREALSEKWGLNNLGVRKINGIATRVYERTAG
ncbi:MAG: phage/plasmid primase, P4 family [Finegoldia magna]|uniref:DNA primase family protein n=1 Tax=Finegoldia magna TaxID=1260 RepID=UPI002912A3A7|nr:phage/plasmid primase, P4 family [Finegoldia magna]MDU5526432.1 phage/plasmid primase, P4 family [Finegoldia magna]